VFFIIFVDSPPSFSVVTGLLRRRFSLFLRRSLLDSSGRSGERERSREGSVCGEVAEYVSAWEARPRTGCLYPDLCERGGGVGPMSSCDYESLCVGGISVLLGRRLHAGRPACVGDIACGRRPTLSRRSALIVLRASRGRQGVVFKAGDVSARGGRSSRPLSLPSWCTHRLASFFDGASGSFLFW
jgi:hypothetical protein